MHRWMQLNFWQEQWWEVFCPEGYCSWDWEAGQPNDDCRQNRREKSWLLLKMQGKVLTPSGNPGWIPVGDGVPDPVLCEGGRTCRYKVQMWFYSMRNRCYSSVMWNINSVILHSAKKPPKQPRTALKKLAMKIRERNTLFLQAVKSQPFYKT